MGRFQAFLDFSHQRHADPVAPGIAGACLIAA